MLLLEYKPCSLIPLNQFNTELRRLLAGNTLCQDLAADLLLHSFRFSDRGAEISQ
jgi:hypothetical protein